MEVRDYRNEDEDAVIALWSQDPEFTPAAVHRSVLRFEDVYDVHTVYLDGRHLVAYGAAFRPPWADAGITFARVCVDRDRAGAGVGSRVWAAVRAGIGNGNGKTVIAIVSDRDDRALAIAEHWGFSQFQHAIQSAVTLRERASPGALPAGFSFELIDDVRGHERADLEALLAEADTSPESAVIGTSHLAGFAASAHPVLALIAHGPDRPAGGIFVTGDGDDADVLLTAVHPRHRRHGLARALKKQLHREAFDRGFRRLITTNEAANIAIRALNHELGYERLRGTRRLRLEL